jgi:hypothetical protein
MSLFDFILIKPKFCSRCGQKMLTAFDCKACGKAICAPCVIECVRLTMLNSMPDLPLNYEPDMCKIFDMGEQGKAPCPLCGEMTAKLRG